MIESALQLVNGLVWPPIAGGITNKLFKVTYGNGANSVLVRVFGGEGVIDRDVENPTFHALTDYLGQPKYLGRFANGRLYEYFLAVLLLLRCKNMRITCVVFSMA